MAMVPMELQAVLGNLACRLLVKVLVWVAGGEGDLRSCASSSAQRLRGSVGI